MLDPLHLVVAAIALLGATSARPSSCQDVLSCSSTARDSHTSPCCTPSPAGLFVFRQRFEPDTGGDVGNWGIDGMEVLDCDTHLAPSSREAYSPAYTHEQIGSFCAKSPSFQGGAEAAEREWAQSEVGEGLEEVWERAWSTAGRWVSTLAPHCLSGLPAGAEVPAFFSALSKLHKRFPVSRILADADITPSPDTTYSLSELVSALSFENFQPVVMCDNATLSSIQWPLYVTGSFQHEVFSAAEGYKTSSTCPKEGIIYPPTTRTPTITSTYTFDEIHRPTPRPITLSNDDSKRYYSRDGDSTIAGGGKRPPQDKKHLRFFSGKEGQRSSEVEEEKRYGRDEL